MEIVERSEKNAVDAQSMFSDTNRKLSEMKTKKEDLELLSVCCLLSTYYIINSNFF